VFRGGVVFDGTGAPPAPADVVVEGDRIVDVGVGLDGDEEIDCTGQLVLPGLFDCHVHFMVDGDFSPSTHGATPFSLNFFLAAERMQRTLDCGITTVREAGGADLGVKEAQARGIVPGPRMQVSITVLSQTGGHGDHWEVCGAHMPGLLDAHPGRPHNVVDGVEGMRHKVREVIRAGADVVKICTSGGVISPRDDPRHAHFRDDELAMCVAEANAAHLFVMAHAQATDGIKAAVRNGVRSIEHGIYLDDEAIEMMLDAGTYLVPTLVAPQGVLDAVERGVVVPQYAIDKTTQVIEVHRASIRRAVEAGVKIAMGTDSGVVPHGQNLRELELMTEVGMSPTDVLVATTHRAAELMGLHHELGSVEPGNRADLVLVDGADSSDPGGALDVTGLRDRIAAVYQDGRRVA
jgi:imidazolonepropionase-like amidohydrolase